MTWLSIRCDAPRLLSQIAFPGCYREQAWEAQTLGQRKGRKLHHIVLAWGQSCDIFGLLCQAARHSSCAILACIAVPAASDIKQSHGTILQAALIHVSEMDPDNPPYTVYGLSSVEKRSTWGTYPSCDPLDRVCFVLS